MAHPKKQNRYNRGQGPQDKMVRDLDALAEYDEFCNKILPRLRQAMADGKNATDIYKIAEAEMAARMVTIALTDKDPKSAMQAIKECFDRSLGKAKETMEVTTRYEKLSEEELDAMLASQEQSLDEDRADGPSEDLLQ